MQLKNPGIVFMGTPEFAVASLEAIIRAGYKVSGVVTAPDKPSGRGLRLHASPVKELALSHGIPVLQPMKLKDPEFLDSLHQLKHDLQVVVAFRMLPEEVWSMPSLGTFNLHASLLPQYRGAAPINWAVINGELKTGVTTFFINHEIDKGSVIYTRETPIGENETAGDVHDRLMQIGADLVVKTIEGIISQKVVPVEQQFINPAQPLKPAPKIFRENCRINWKNKTITLHNFIRGLSPHPTAWSEIVSDAGEPLNVKIFEARPVSEGHKLKPGEIVTNRKNFIWVATSDGYIS
ncbi:MAG TPA: methionyl-tRNA formyltransferase, partial [Bacteroidales bacterium]|nr:methionyl-tRNA formyltransferase [Bacteroidales bacterium]